jgi:hypothetical protein
MHLDMEEFPEWAAARAAASNGQQRCSYCQLKTIRH